MASSLFLSLAWERVPKGPQVYPVFLPFHGCPSRCIYCAQDATTGCSATRSLADILADLVKDIEARSHPCELALYGGTFTALPEADFQAALACVTDLLRRGKICALRCSTRPDALAPDRLQALADAGFSTVELGIQSFAPHVLARARRNYSAACARAACERIVAHGFRLGVQLLPGLPGCSQADFCEDVAIAIASGATLLRFYPCLVLRGTALATCYERGSYHPWDMETTLSALARGYLYAKEACVPVIRMGLAWSRQMEACYLAGPAHPALGARVQARALFLAVSRALAPYQNAHVVALSLPRFVQGFFWGEKREMEPHWASLGMYAEQIHFTRKGTLALALTLP